MASFVSRGITNEATCTITSDDANDELIDTGTLLLARAGAAGMGMTLAACPSARTVITAPRRQHLADEHTAILNQANWTSVGEAHLKEGGPCSEWIAYATRRIPLNAFTGRPDDQ